MSHEMGALSGVLAIPSWAKEVLPLGGWNELGRPSENHDFDMIPEGYFGPSDFPKLTGWLMNALATSVRDSERCQK